MANIFNKIGGWFGGIKNIPGKIKGMSRKQKTWLGIAAAAVVIILFVLISGANRNSNTVSAFQTMKAEHGSLSATIGATGSVRANQTAILNWQSSGTVETVNAGVGDKVQAGEVLATLLQTSLPQNIISAQADLVTAQRNLDNLLNSDTTGAQAQLDVITAQKSYDKAKATLDNLLAKNKGGTSEDILNAEAKLTVAQNNVRNAATMYEYVKYLGDEDPKKAQAYTNLYNARQAQESAQNEVNYFLLRPAAHDIDEARAKLAVAEAQLADAQRAVDRLKDGSNPEDIAAAQARVAAIQATINMSRLIAPSGGTITEANPMVGDQVAIGTSGFRVDDLSHLLVDVQISEVDINSVEIGQTVTITFDAVQGGEYRGKVVEVAQAGTSSQGAVNFGVTVELTDADTLVKPGMTAAVIVTTKQVENALLVPNQAVRLVDGQRVVYILRNGQPVQVKITLGASSDTKSEVLSGDLKVGDAIILNPPSNLFNGPPNGGGGSFGGGGN